jgi:transcriptional regulator with XRE-family HTH domain
MGRGIRIRSLHLAEKLLHIRLALGLSQSEIHKRLELKGVVHYAAISKYETGKNEPPLPVLLRYARLAGVCMDDLVDDQVKLPKKLPGLKG